MNYKIVSFILLALFLNKAKAQEHYPVVRKTFDWKPYEQKNDILIRSFINTHKDIFTQFKQNDPYSPTIQDLIKSLHLLDLDKDGNNEIIFDGPSGGEANEVMIFQKINQKYEIILTEIQNIDTIEWEANKPKIYISDWGCCAAYTGTEKIFTMTKAKNGKIEFTKIYQALAFYPDRKPDSLFTTPIRFKVNVDNYKLRFAPRFDDSTAQQWDEEGAKSTGNVIANLPVNSTGYAIGFKTDKSGRHWWYVEIDENSKLRNLKLYTDDKFPAKVIGWTSSNFLERL